MGPLLVASDLRWQRPGARWRCGSGHAPGRPVCGTRHAIGANTVAAVVLPTAWAEEATDAEQGSQAHAAPGGWRLPVKA